MRKTIWRSVAIAALVLGVGILGSAVNAQKTKGKTRLAETKILMRCIMQPNCKGLADVLKDAGPADDKAWGQVVQYTSLLNEMSYLLMDDGRCPDGTWAGAAKTLRECSAKVLEAAKGQKVADAQGAFTKLTGACAACHKAHKAKS